MTPATSKEPTASNRATSLLRQDLANIAQRYGRADERLHKARVLCDQNELGAAEEERREAMGDFFAVGSQLADLFLLFLRHALEHRPLELKIHLGELLRAVIGPDMAELANAVARLEKTK